MVNLTTLEALNWSEFISLALAHAIAVASPGPDFAIVTKHSIQYGKTIGRITAFGIGLAILLHVCYALFGFNLLVQSNDTLFQIIKWIGAIYFLYLARAEWLSTMKKSEPSSTLTPNRKQKELSSWNAFKLGFLTNALNGKAMLFFLFLFTSIVSKNSPLSNKLFYGIWLSLYTFAWFFLVASLFGKQEIRNLFLRYSDWFSRVIALLFLLFAILILLK